MMSLRSLLFTALVLAGTGQVMAVTISPTFEGRVRDVNATSFGPLVETTGMEVFLNSSGFDTRAIMDYSTTGVSPPITSVTLDFTTAFPGVPIDVYAYSANGVAELSDAFAGSLVGSFTSSATPISIPLVAAPFQTIVTGGATHFGIRMSTTAITPTGFVYTGSTLTINEPVPEPSTAVLAIVSLLLLGGVCWRRRRRA